jgi:hypothetical protein
MKSAEKFWSGFNLEAATLAESKGCRIFRDTSEMMFLVKKFKDESILHTRETQLLQSRDVTKILAFLKTI